MNHQPNYDATLSLARASPGLSHTDWTLGPGGAAQIKPASTTHTQGESTLDHCLQTFTMNRFSTTTPLHCCLEEPSRPHLCVSVAAT